MEKLIAEGEEREIAKREARSEKRGIVKGEAKSLSRLFEPRFGRLPAALKARIGRAKLAQLDAWIDRVLDAKSMDAVFGVVEKDDSLEAASVERSRGNSNKTRQFRRSPGRAKQTPIFDKPLSEQPTLYEPMAPDSFRGRAQNVVRPSTILFATIPRRSAE